MLLIFDVAMHDGLILSATVGDWLMRYAIRSPVTRTHEDETRR